jgi:hypothetical protein
VGVKDARLLPRLGNIYACVKKLHALGDFCACGKSCFPPLTMPQVSPYEGNRKSRPCAIDLARGLHTPIVSSYTGRFERCLS